MAHVTIRKSHGLGAEEAKARFGNMAAELQSRFGVTVSWQGFNGTIAGPGISGTCTVESESVEVALKLGLMLRPMKSKISDKLARTLEKQLEG